MQIKEQRETELDLGLITYENKASIKTEDRSILRDYKENLKVTWS